MTKDQGFFSVSASVGNTQPQANNLDSKQGQAHPNSFLPSPELPELMGESKVVNGKDKGNIGHNKQINPDSEEKTSVSSRILWGWAVLFVLIFGSVGFGATTMLLKLPGLPNCPKIFWPLASGSMRMYCAEMQAEEKTVEGYLKAIALVEALPQDHPMRSQINENVESWAMAILDLGETQFHEGKLEDAIATARQIPPYVKAYNLVTDKINYWQKVWAEAEAAEKAIEKELKQSDWHQAFREAVKLAYIDNKYWSTTKYEAAVNKIQSAREESSKLDAAYAQLRRGGADNLLNAIAEAEKIPETSYAYQEAKTLISDAKNKLLKLIQNQIDQEQWQDLVALADRIPANLGLQEQVNDWRTLARAGVTAQNGTIPNLETAVIQLQDIDVNSPLYSKSQDLIITWQKEIEDLGHLEKGRQLAQMGSINDLTSAIAEVQLIPNYNPRYDEAQQEIKAWTKQIQILEDQPILNRANELASNNSIESMQEAISQARLIVPNRALYNEAQEQIRTWQISIEKQQDQPILDQAISLANAGDYSTAIETAQQIGEDRALYAETRSQIRSWQREIKANALFQEAQVLASNASTESLVKAINLVQQIPTKTDVRNRGMQAANNWSYQILAIAQNAANTSIPAAIEIAKLVPSGTTAYNSAIAQVEAWNRLLNPPSIDAATDSLSDINNNSVNEIGN